MIIPLLPIIVSSMGLPWINLRAIGALDIEVFSNLESNSIRWSCPRAGGNLGGGSWSTYSDSSNQMLEVLHRITDEHNLSWASCLVILFAKISQFALDCNLLIVIYSYECLNFMYSLWRFVGNSLIVFNHCAPMTTLARPRATMEKLDCSSPAEIYSFDNHNTISHWRLGN